MARRPPRVRRPQPRRAGARARHAVVCVLARGDACGARGLHRRVDRASPPAVLRDEGQPFAGGAADLCPGRMRLRHCLGGRTRTRARRRRRCQEDGLLRRRQTARRDAARARSRRQVLQRREPGRTADVVGGSARDGRARAGEPAHQPGRGCQNAPLHLHRLEGQQVRHRARRSARCVPRSGASAGHRRRRHRLPHWLADHRGRALCRRAGAAARPDRSHRAREHRHPPPRPRRRPGHHLHPTKAHPTPAC
jgi:hypothetical protein